LSRPLQRELPVRSCHILGACSPCCGFGARPSGDVTRAGASETASESTAAPAIALNIF